MAPIGGVSRKGRGINEYLNLYKMQDHVRDFMGGKWGYCLNKLEVEMTFEEKIVKACLFYQNGDPIEDVLDREDIEKAVCALSDLFLSTGVVDLSVFDD